MNNILTFEDYKKMNIRQVESLIYHQFIEEEIKPEMNEGLIRNAINKASSKFIQNALADEIEKGKELEKSIKEALDGLDKGFDEIEKKINGKGKRSKNSKLNNIEKVKEAIKAVQSQAFDTLTMLGSEGEIDFAGFMGSSTVAAAANFGILFAPIRSLFITRKAYKYFLGIIKQTIRRNLLIIQLNFDQFENLILQKSFETDDDAEERLERDTMFKTIGELTEHLCKDKTLFKKESQHKKVKEQADIFLKLSNERLKLRKENSKKSPYVSLFNDQYNNTYTRTLEQIKQYINDDSQKELDALKNSITKMAGNDVELGPYGELLISAAEEYAVHTCHGINNNFIKMSSVFNLENQKKLIQLIVETQKENEAEAAERLKKKRNKEDKKKLEKSIKDGKKLYEEKLKDSFEKYTFDTLEETFDDNDIKCLSAFFNSDEGQEPYEELIKNNPLYKYYFIEDIQELNTLLNSINNLNIIEISNINDFYNKIYNKDESLYYIMAERSIKDAVESKKSKDYFGIEFREDDLSKSKPNTLSDEFKKDKDSFNSLLQYTLDIDNNINDSRKKYFLTFRGSGDSLFDILHKEFKTEIFDVDKKYVKDISTENKETIMKLIYKNLKNIGKNIPIPSRFAEYLIRLEAHMLLKNKEPWFIVKNNNKLKNCFEPKSDKIINRHAFVEIHPNDVEDIKKFLTKFHELSENDFKESDEKETNDKQKRGLD